MVITSNRTRKKTAEVLLWSGVLLAVAGLVYMIAAPRGFRATATVRVWKNGVVETNHPAAPYDPETTLPGECELMRSHVVLDPVIQTLGLNERWAARYHQGVTLPTPDTRERLRLMTSVEPVLDSSIISVTVTGDDPTNVAAIANEIVRSYCAYRTAQRADLSHQAVGILDHQLVELNNQIAGMESNLVQITRSINFEPATNSPNYLSPELYQQTQSNRTALQTNIQAQTRQLYRVNSAAGDAFVQAAVQLEGATNTTLPETLRQLDQARQRLADLKTAAAPLPNATDLPAAEAAVVELNKIADDTAHGVVVVREGQIAGMQAELDVLTQQLKNVTTNLGEFGSFHPKYQQAHRQLELLKDRREVLLENIKDDDSKDAMLPTSLSAEIVNEAGVLAQREAPNQPLALAFILAGMVLSAAGVYWKKAKAAPPAKAGRDPRKN